MKKYLMVSVLVTSALQSGCVSTVKIADETTYKNLPYAEGNINYCSSKGAYESTVENKLKSQLKELKSFYSYDSNYYNQRVSEEEKNAAQAVAQAETAEHDTSRDTHHKKMPSGE